MAHKDSCWCPECLGPSVNELQTQLDLWIKVADDLYLIHDDYPTRTTGPQCNSGEWNDIIRAYEELKWPTE